MNHRSSDDGQAAVPFQHQIPAGIDECAPVVQMTYEN